MSENGTAEFVHEMVAKQATAHPDTVALRWGDGELTYRELQASIKRFARHLAGTRRAALLNDRSPELVIAILAVLASGGACVPLDNTYPKRRLDHMLADSGADRLLCRSHLVDLISIPDGCRLELLDEVINDVKKIALTDQEQSAADISEEDTVYVTYTSGSTGWPKGIALPHRAVSNFISWQVADSGSTVGWNTLQLWPFSVDVAFTEIFSTWASGGTVVLVSEETRKDWGKLLRFVDEQQIHRIWLSFTTLYQFAEAARQANFYPTSIREVITAGDQLRVDESVREFFARTGARLQNQYGMTECSIVTAKTLDGDPKDWPGRPSIGTALPNIIVEVVDEHLNSLPVGDEGEICIGGACVPDGYLNLPEATAERFPEWPGRGTRAYLSGDMGRLLPSGEIEFLGRRDTQVKINSARIELEEIEVQLRALENVSDALVTAHTEAAEQFLAAHYIPAPGAEVDEVELRKRLTEVLPQHFVPTRYFKVDKFRFTHVGKVDREAHARAVTQQ
ncbi:amino acid adenylation domain-containing protein [Mycolicibacterium cosmeticum]|uniref:amino acid adenylation domain-containing protein n=1 Tax=Mycolicibacterium cosmeticum TaxID=258533 RepID=UPI003204E7A6